MRNPNIRTLRVESIFSSQPVIAELEVLEDRGDVLIVRTFGTNLRKLTKMTDPKRGGDFYHVEDLKETGEEWNSKKRNT